MECVCGCGTKVSSRSLTEVNLLASQIALELLAWDRARSQGKISAEDSERVESLIARGSNGYQRLLMVLHGERDSTSTAEGEEWMDESLGERSDRESMTEHKFLRGGQRLRLTEEDYEQLDRLHPEQSFTGGSGDGIAATAEVEGRRDDIAGQLERLGALHSEGTLTDEEFIAAKARVIG